MTTQPLHVHETATATPAAPSAPAGITKRERRAGSAILTTLALVGFGFAAYHVNTNDASRAPQTSTVAETRSFEP